MIPEVQTTMNESELEALEVERSYRTAENGTANPGKEDKQNYPIGPWIDTTSIIFDTITSGLGVSERVEAEKKAVAISARNVAVKRIPQMEYSEEIVFLCVALPIGLSVFMEYISSKNRVKNEQGKQTRVSSGQNRNGEITPDQERTETK